MSLTESIVEDAGLECSCLRASTLKQLVELGLAVGHRVSLHQSRTLATLRDTLLPRLLSGELSVVDMEKEAFT